MFIHSPDKEILYTTNPRQLQSAVVVELVGTRHGVCRSNGERDDQQARHADGDDRRQRDGSRVLRHQQLLRQHRHDARHIRHHGRYAPRASILIGRLAEQFSQSAVCVSIFLGVWMTSFEESNFRHSYIAWQFIVTLSFVGQGHVKVQRYRWINTLFLAKSD